MTAPSRRGGLWLPQSDARMLRHHCSVHTRNTVVALDEIRRPAVHKVDDESTPQTDRGAKRKSVIARLNPDRSSPRSRPGRTPLNLEKFGLTGSRNAGYEASTAAKALRLAQTGFGRLPATSGRSKNDLMCKDVCPSSTLGHPSLNPVEDGVILRQKTYQEV